MRSLPLFAVLAGRAAGDRPAALRRATGIDATEAIWGAPFRELAALYGGAPPAAALGVSAKFCPGRDHTARYHVALEPQPPRDGGPPLRRVPRAAQRKAAERTAAALQAPPLVHDWLEAILAASPPIFGFGVDRDAGAAKVYVMNHRGEALPPLAIEELGEDARRADAALPPVARGPGGKEPVRMLSLEWRVGGAGEVALRQYFVEDLAPDAAVAQVRSRLERFAVVGDEKVADALEALAARYEAATEDIAVTPAFLPSDLPGHALPVAARERAKVGLKFEEGLEASTFDGVLRAAAQRAAASEGIRHGISNVQAGRGFVTLYRHPEAFGHVDPLVHRQLLARGRRRLYGDEAGTVDGDERTACEVAHDVFSDTAFWGKNDGGCKEEQAAEEVEKHRTCPMPCRDVIAELATACGDCAEERVTCEGQVKEDDAFYHGQVKYEFETKVALRAQGSASAQDCVDALREHLKSTALERYRDANHVFSDFEFETGVAEDASAEDEWIPHRRGWHPPVCEPGRLL